MSTLGQTNGLVPVTVKLSSKLKVVHAEIHESTAHDDAPVIHKHEEYKLHSNCALAWFCVHLSDAGIVLVAMRRQLLDVLTLTRFPRRNKLERKLFADTADIILCTIGEEHVFEPDGLEPAPAPLLFNCWFHVDSVSLAPKEFEAQVFEPCGGHGVLTLAERRTEIHLRGLWEFHGSWNRCKPLDQQLKCFLSFSLFQEASGHWAQ